MKTTVLIMAGGQGERFWPKSRVKLPKQFLNITDENKALASTIQDDLIPKIKDEIAAVSGLTAEYIKLYD